MLEAMKHAATAGSHVRAVRDVLAIGTKLWRLQQAQRSLAPSNNGLKTSSGNGKSNSRPLYSLPSARRVGDDIAAQLLTECRRHCGTLRRVCTFSLSFYSMLAPVKLWSIACIKWCCLVVTGAICMS